MAGREQPQMGGKGVGEAALRRLPEQQQGTGMSRLRQQAWASSSPLFSLVDLNSSEQGSVQRPLTHSPVYTHKLGF